MNERACPICEEPLPTSRTRPHVYCSHACRQQAVGLEQRAVSLAERAAVAQAQWERLQQARKRG
jgi:endogenous inhibitor of DNA gyrase (YacG/DUF329 family)